MKRTIAVLLAVLFLTGCRSAGSVDRAIEFREQLLKSNGCSFDAVITADYGETIYTFTMQCNADRNGTMVFTVTEPDTINGITGKISQDGGKLTFDDQVLAFEMLADGQITPISAPWLLIRALRSGYISACGEEDGLLRVSIEDSYLESAIHFDVWLGPDGSPVRGEILWQGRRVVTIDVRSFSYM